MVWLVNADHKIKQEGERQVNVIIKNFGLRFFPFSKPNIAGPSKQFLLLSFKTFPPKQSGQRQKQ
jgi:hypothetical protein